MAHDLHSRAGTGRFCSNRGMALSVAFSALGLMAIASPLTAAEMQNGRASRPEEPHHTSVPASHSSAIGRNPHLHGFSKSAEEHGKIEPRDEHKAADGHPEHRSIESRDEHHDVEHHDADIHDEHRVIEARDDHYRRGVRYEPWYGNHWYYTGDYATWYVNHTGLGTIEGYVTTSGSPAPNTQVWLRKPRGRAFRSRHAKHFTYTDAFGHFTMRGVNPGNYRLMTKTLFGETHAQVHVDPGSTSEVRLGL